MNYLDASSLFQTVDHVAEALFFGLIISNAEKKEIIDFILNQHKNPKAYANTFAPTENDFRNDLILFTGERIKSNAGRCHMIGEESSRILRLLQVKNEEIKKALQTADKGLLSYINTVKKDPSYIQGTFCCKACSCALWLNMSSGGLTTEITLLESGIQYVKNNRDGKGNWKGFPGNYLLYVLNEIEPELALDELKYAGISIERKLKRTSSSESKYSLRRKEIYRQILNKINSN